MKLYTEEQVKEIYFKGFNEKYKEINIDFVQNCIDSLTPIELPTDEEIEEYIESKNYSLEYDTGFKQCSKWMRDKIQGGNN